MTKKMFWCLLMASVVVLAGCSGGGEQAGVTTSAGGETDAEAAAVKAANDWLALIDAGKYGEGWDTAAEFMKNAVTREDLIAALEGVRRPLGAVVSREVQTKTFMTEVPGMPDGEYLVIQMKTSFENKKTTIETITPMLEKNGTWRITAYLIN